MGETVRFAISLDSDLLTSFEQLRERQNYASRSEAIRDLIRDHLVEQNWDDKRAAMGTVTLVYDHHVKDLSDKLTTIQHDHHESILSTMHVHLDHDNCLEVLVVKGKGARIRSLADRLISTKGVKHGKLTLTTSGKDLV